MVIVIHTGFQLFTRAVLLPMGEGGGRPANLRVAEIVSCILQSREIL
jgi:hypothetical protein